MFCTSAIGRKHGVLWTTRADADLLETLQGRAWQTHMEYDSTLQQQHERKHGVLSTTRAACRPAGNPTGAGLANTYGV